jgi:hypothetical protein
LRIKPLRAKRRGEESEISQHKGNSNVLIEICDYKQNNSTMFHTGPLSLNRGKYGVCENDEGGNKFSHTPKRCTHERGRKACYLGL